MKQEKFDVAVIGSGMGGMCAAALLAHSGYQTLVVEKLPFIGGRCSTMEYKGFKLTTGAIGIEIGRDVDLVFREVGARFEVRPIEPSFYRIGGKFYELPKKRGLSTLLSLASKDDAEASMILDIIRRGLRWAEPSNSMNFRDWLLQFTQNERILQLFQGLISGILVVNCDEIPAGLVFHFLKEISGYRTGYAPEGNIILMEALAKVVKNSGGEVWVGCKVKQILVAGGKVKGIVVQGNEGEVEVTSSIVISNAGPQITVELAERENFDKGYLKDATENLRSAPIIFMQFAASRPLLKYPAVIVTDARRVNLVACPTLICPELAPSGKHLIITSAALGNSSPPYDLKKELEINMEDLREILPGFDQQAELLNAGCFHSEWPGFRAWPSDDLPQKTPIENLYNVGDGVKPQGCFGLPACARTARIVADDVKRRFSPGSI